MPQIILEQSSQTSQIDYFQTLERSVFPSLSSSGSVGPPEPGEGVFQELLRDLENQGSGRSSLSLGADSPWVSGDSQPRSLSEKETHRGSFSGPVGSLMLQRQYPHAWSRGERSSGREQTASRLQLGVRFSKISNRPTSREP